MRVSTRLAAGAGLLVVVAASAGAAKFPRRSADTGAAIDPPQATVLRTMPASGYEVSSPTVLETTASKIDVVAKGRNADHGASAIDSVFVALLLAPEGVLEGRARRWRTTADAIHGWTVGRSVV